MNITSAIRFGLSGKRPKGSIYPHLYHCTECGLEWVSGGYARTRSCECGSLVGAQRNPEFSQEAHDENFKVQP